MTNRFKELQTWAKALSDEELTHALFELRDRGHAIAAFGTQDVADVFDADFDNYDEQLVTDWLDTHREALEERMCEAACAMINDAITEFFPDEEQEELRRKLDKEYDR